jgi:hypothetical protein
MESHVARLEVELTVVTLEQEPLAMSQRPVHEIRMGRIRAAVWENESQNGLRHTVTFSRAYKDGEQWKYSQSFFREDLPLLYKLADQAHTWIYGQHPEHQPS